MSAELTTYDGTLSRPVRLTRQLVRITTKESGADFYACDECFTELKRLNEKNQNSSV